VVEGEKGVAEGLRDERVWEEEAPGVDWGFVWEGGTGGRVAKDGRGSGRRVHFSYRCMLLVVH
jgi:hypothetical protein